MADVAAGRRQCAACQTDLAPQLLACPACRALVHAETLGSLAASAERDEAGGRIDEAVQAWRRALELLPVETAQAQAIRLRIDTLTRRLESARPTPTAIPAWLAPLGVVGLALWKFKFLIGLVLTKGKLLLVGLTKSSTLFSMLAAVGVYWTLWGWWFALGFVLMIYVHEMGHVAALSRLGIRASAPMFVPGLGAFVRMEQYPASPREDARVGLAGPMWGLGAALVAYGGYLATAQPLLGALAHSAALLNLFNLVPVWQLDGARGMRAVNRAGRIGIAVLVSVAFLATQEGTLLLVGLAAWWTVFHRDMPEESDTLAAGQLAFLVLSLTLLSQVRVPLTPGA